MGHFFGRHRGREALSDSGQLEHQLDHAAVGRRCEPQPPPSRDRLNRLARTGEQWKMLAVALLQAPHHLCRDVLGRHVHAQRIAHVARPFG